LDSREVGLISSPTGQTMGKKFARPTGLPANGKDPLKTIPHGWQACRAQRNEFTSDFGACDIAARLKDINHTDGSFTWSKETRVEDQKASQQKPS